MKKSHTRSIVITALFAALSIVLMYLGTPLPSILPPYLELDFSDFPALLASYSLGPIHGVAVALVKNVFHLIRSKTIFVGELSNFILSSLFVVPAGLIYKKNKTKKGAYLGALVGLVVMTSLSIVSNTFIIYPAYVKAFGLDQVIQMSSVIIPSIDSVLEIILVFNTPFTFVKGLLNTILTFLLYKRLSPIIRTGKLR